MLKLFLLSIMSNTTVKNIVITIIIVALCGLLVWAIIGKSNEPIGALSLYFRPECPHCQNVEKYIADNKIGEKFTIQIKNIDENGEYANELMARSQLCAIDAATVGVPFLYDSGECYMGEDEIINYFEQKL